MKRLAPLLAVIALAITGCGDRPDRFQESIQCGEAGGEYVLLTPKDTHLSSAISYCDFSNKESDDAGQT